MTPYTKRSECTAEEALRYLQVYFATVDLVSEALGKLQTLAADATTVSQRSLYRAKALEAERDLELLKNQRRAFLADEVAVRAPSETMVREVERQSQLLAQLDSDSQKASAIVELCQQAAQAFESLRMH